MSGDGNSSGGSGGGGSRFDLNSFDDWAGMYNFLGTPGSSPGTQASTTPQAYQTPHFDVDAYYRPSPQRYGQSPGLSQIPENFPAERTLEYRPIGGGSARIGVNAEEEQEEEGVHEVVGDGGRHPYSEKETLALYDAWISVSYDPVVGNQQTHLCFWKKVTELYNARRPKNTFARNVKMLRSHWDRCDKDVKKFCAIYRAEEANYQSGASGADILRAALRVFKDDVGKDFKHVEVWSQVHHLDRWAGGVQSDKGSGSKRTKHTPRGHYSSSDGGEGEGNTSQEGTPTDDAGGSSDSRRRPQGTKAAKAARARTRVRGRGRGESSQAGSGSGTGSNTLMSMYLLATMADTSKMNPRQFEAHMDGIEHMKAQLGIPDRSTLGAPPTSGDDAPAE